MISLEARKYRGACWLIIRIWDGYDKPDYYPIMKITEKELDFKGGRFKNCNNVVFLKIKDLYLLIDKPRKELELVINWIHENIINQWDLDIEDNFGKSCWRFSFTNE